MKKNKKILLGVIIYFAVLPIIILLLHNTFSNPENNILNEYQNLGVKIETNND